MTNFEIASLMLTIATTTWAIAATIYRPKPARLEPIYQKLDEIVAQLGSIREGYVKETDCQRIHDNLLKTLNLRKG